MSGFSNNNGILNPDIFGINTPPKSNNNSDLTGIINYNANTPKIINGPVSVSSLVSPVSPVKATPLNSSPSPTNQTAMPVPPTPPSQNVTEPDLLGLVDAMFKSPNSTNPLNTFFNITYHWKLFILPDFDIIHQSDARTINELYQAIDNYPQIVVAESGATTYNIKEVELTTVAGPAFGNKNLRTMTFRIQIVEPITVGFLDTLKNAGIAMSAKNINKMPYYLQLSFMGYDEIGNQILNPLVNAGLESSRWIWQIQIGNIETKFDAGGSIYDLTCIAYNDGAYDTEVISAPQAITMEGSNIGQMLSNLGNNMTNSWKMRYGNQDSIFNFKMHTIVNPPPAVTNTDPNTWQTQSTSNPNYNSQRIFPMHGGVGQIGAQITSGTPFPDMLEWMLVNNEQAQNFAISANNIITQTDVKSPNINQSGTSSTSSSYNTNPQGIKEIIVFCVETDVEIKGYDRVAGDYIKQYNVHIYPYYTQAPVISPQQRDDARDPIVQQAMIKKLIQRGFLLKHYEYLYTGENTEVIDFDVHANFAWYAQLSKLYGARSNVDNVEFNAQIQKQLRNAFGNASEVPNLINQASQQIQTDTQNLLPLQNKLDSYSTQLNAISSQILSAQAVLNDPTATQQERANASEKKAQATKQQNTLFIQQASTSNQAIILNNRINANNNFISNSLQSITGTSTQSTSSIKFAEDLLNPDGSFALSNITGLQYNFFNYPISFRQRDTSSHSGTGFTGQYHRDRSIYGDILDQLYQPMSSALSIIDLSIRGDPYWIGFSNLHRMLLNRTENNLSGTINASKNLPNFVTGDTTFLIAFKYPIKTSNEFVPQFKLNDTFTGIYRAQTIISSFSDGIFKQKITGSILPLINLPQALNNNMDIFSASGLSSSSNQNGYSSGNDNRNISPALTTKEQQNNAIQLAQALNNASNKYGANLTPANIDGIVANSYRESSLNPNQGITNIQIDSNNEPSGGLFSWNGSRLTNMYDYINNQLPSGSTPVGPNNPPNIQQQADYAVAELTNQSGAEGNTGTTLQVLQANPNDAGASANIFIAGFEKPLDVSGGQSRNRSFLSNLYGTGQGSSATFLK